jgi:hypothetical protein
MAQSVSVAVFVSGCLGESLVDNRHNDVVADSTIQRRATFLRLIIEIPDIVQQLVKRVSID